MPLPPITEQARTLARSLSFGMTRGPLAAPPSKWEPAALRRELARLECEIETEDRVRLADVNKKLERLGIRGRLTPLPTLAPIVVRRNPAAVARRIRPVDETDELRRRMGWLGPDVPMELVMEHMTAELDALRRR